MSGKPASGDELRWLLGGQADLAPFLSQDWDIRSVVIPGITEKFDWLGMTVEEFLVRACKASSETTVAAAYERDGERQTLICQGEMARELYRAGFTICFDNFSDYHESLHELCASIKRCSRFPGKVVINGYLSPDGSGFPTHFDGQSVFSMQVLGEKEWRFGTTPVWSYPERNAGVWYTGEEPLPRGAVLPDCVPRHDELPEFRVLTRGETLYLPPGTWHSARARGVSLGLTLTFEALSHRRFLLEILDRELSPVSATALRSYLRPVGPEAPGLPPEQMTAMQAAVAEAQQILASLSQETLREHWATRVFDDDAQFLRTSSPPILEDSVLRRAYPSIKLVGSWQGEQGVHVLCGATHGLVDDEQVALLDWVLTQDRFVASDATQGGSISWEETCDFLEAAVGMGMLKVES